MNDDQFQSERPDAPSYSPSEPLNVTETSPVSGAVSTPEEEQQQDASSSGAARGGGGSAAAQSESPSESQQSPPPEADPIEQPASNGSATGQRDQARPDGCGPSEEGAEAPKGNSQQSKDSSSGAGPPPPSAVAEPPAVPKVKIHLVAVGSAPILKRTKFQIGALGKTLHTSSRMGVAYLWIHSY
jgi:hypothetical protein